MTHLHSRCVDIKLLKNGKGLLKQLIADCDVCDVRCIIVVKPVDVLHHTSAISFDGCQDQQVLQISVGDGGKRGNVSMQ